MAVTVRAPLVVAIAALAVGASAQAIPPPAPVPFQTLAKGEGGTSGDPSRSVTVRSERRWRRVWRSLAGGERPEIDFRRHMVIAVGMGSQPSGGHAIAIKRIERTDDGWLVRVVEREPGCPAAGVITSPYHLVRVKRTRKDVRFERERREVGCR
jgi:PrcB C-terminal